MFRRLGSEQDGKIGTGELTYNWRMGTYHLPLNAAQRNSLNSIKWIKHGKNLRGGLVTFLTELGDTGSLEFL